MNNIADFLIRNLESNSHLVAIKEADREITYLELFKSSYSLSKEIRNYNINYSPAPILVESKKRIETVIGIFAVIFSGHIYCPYDEDLSSEKKRKLNNRLKAEIKIVHEDSDLTDLANVKTLVATITTEEIDVTGALSSLSNYLRENLISTDPCYIIHTSGSTGEPKGVTITHGGVIDYINWVNSIFNFSKEDNFGSQAPFIFDNSTLDIYASFSAGATLCLIPKRIISQPLKLMEYIEQERISVIFWVPSLYIFLEKFKAMKHKELLTSLKWCLFAGEVMPKSTLMYWKDNLPGARFANLYGPTEITVDCTYYLVPEDFGLDEVPIGVPCENSSILILDENNKQSEEGELLVKGIGNSIGYWNNQAETERKFVQNPLHDNFLDICYRTGDLVKEIDGLIFYRGRNDDQIKFQGHRIELGEIENTIIEINHINAVVCGFNQEKQFIWAAYEGIIKENDLQNLLISKLQSYMIPKKLVRLDRFPSLPNGKIDRSEIKKVLE